MLVGKVEGACVFWIIILFLHVPLMCLRGHTSIEETVAGSRQRKHLPVRYTVSGFRKEVFCSGSGVLDVYVPHMCPSD